MKTETYHEIVKKYNHDDIKKAFLVSYVTDIFASLKTDVKLKNKAKFHALIDEVFSKFFDKDAEPFNFDEYNFCLFIDDYIQNKMNITYDDYNKELNWTNTGIIFR